MQRVSNQPTYKRQRFLLSFIQHLNNDVTTTDLQKLVFLTTMHENMDYYEFVPYIYGAYSFQLAEDVDILCKRKFLEKQGSRVHAVKSYDDEAEFYIASERGNELLRKAYRAYPYYSINSKILDRLFEKRESTEFISNRKQYRKDEQILFTIGYEGKSIEAFVNTLIANDVRLLCDVRRNPLSRKFGFSKTRLYHIVEAVGIQYVHIPQLGIESSLRTELGTVEDYENLFKEYAKKLPELHAEIDEIFLLYRSKNRIALMCYEKEYQMCHRHIIRDSIVKTYGVRSVDL